MTTQPSPSGCREQQYQIRLMHEASLLILVGHLEIKKKKRQKERKEKEIEDGERSKKERGRGKSRASSSNNRLGFFLSKFLLSYF